VYREVLSLAEKVNEERKERERLRLSEKEYGVFKLLKSHATAANERELVDATKAIMDIVKARTFPKWYEKSEVVQEIEREVLLYLIERGGFKDVKTARDEIVKFLKRQAEREEIGA